MKYIFFLFLLCAPFFVSANEYIDISVSPENIVVGEDFTLNVQVQLDPSTPGEMSLEIPGIEVFDVFSQGKTMKYQNINGEMSGVLEYRYQMSAPSPGKYTLGPVKFLFSGKQLVDDTVLTLNVGETGPQSVEDISPAGETKVSPDDIRGLRISGFFVFAIIFSVISILALMYMLIYFLLQKQILSPKSHKEILQKEDIDIKQLQKQKLLSLKEKIGTLSSQDFFREYNSLLREIFETHIGTIAFTATLQELSSDKIVRKHPLFSLFERSYMYEYREKEVSHETQKKYIDDSISLL